jgi:hypothetical protein
LLPWLVLPSGLLWSMQRNPERQAGAAANHAGTLAEPG